MSNNPNMPFGFSPKPDEFDHALRQAKEGLRKRFGEGVPATSAIDEAILQGLREMHAGRSPTGFWVRVTRRAIDLLRRRQRYGRILERIAAEQLIEGADPAEEAAARELYQRLVGAAEGLTDTERHVWLLHCEGRAEGQIATALNRSTAAVKMALCRARQKVLERLNLRPAQPEAADER